MTAGWRWGPFCPGARVHGLEGRQRVPSSAHRKRMKMKRQRRGRLLRRSFIASPCAIARLERGPAFSHIPEFSVSFGSRNVSVEQVVGRARAGNSEGLEGCRDAEKLDNLYCKKAARGAMSSKRAGHTAGEVYRVCVRDLSARRSVASVLN